MIQAGRSGIGPESGGSATALDELSVVTKDALAGRHGEYEIVVANPPFGKKSSVTIVNEAGEQQKESRVINALGSKGNCDTQSRPHAGSYAYRSEL